MHGFTLAFLALFLANAPLELPEDVEEIHGRQFSMPLRFDPNRQDTIERVRLFVSEDSGKTWKHAKDYKPTDKEVQFTAPRDGLYWFALQVVFKDGKREPAEADLAPAMKVQVKTERKALKTRKSYKELQRETVEQLRKRIRELEGAEKRTEPIPIKPQRVVGPAR